MSERDHRAGVRAAAPDPAASALQRALAAAAHLSMWLGAFAAANVHLAYLLYALPLLWLPPACLWLATRRRLRFAAAHCAQALALGACVSLLCVLLLAPALLIFGAALIALPVLIVVLLVGMGLGLAATVAAARGQRYRHPLLRRGGD